jgi:hypothetical protein
MFDNDNIDSMGTCGQTLVETTTHHARTRRPTTTTRVILPMRRYGANGGRALSFSCFDANRGIANRQVSLDSLMQTCFSGFVDAAKCFGWLHFQMNKIVSK